MYPEDILTDYKELNGTVLPTFGIQNIEEFFRQRFSDVMQKTQNGKWKGIPTEKSGHINDLVSQQKSKGKFKNRPQNFKKVSGVNSKMDQNSNSLLPLLPVVNPEKPKKRVKKSPRKSKKPAVTHLIKNGIDNQHAYAKSSIVESCSFERKRNYESKTKHHQKFEKKSRVVRGPSKQEYAAYDAVWAAFAKNKNK